MNINTKLGWNLTENELDIFNKELGDSLIYDKLDGLVFILNPGFWSMPNALLANMYSSPPGVIELKIKYDLRITGKVSGADINIDVNDESTLTKFNNALHEWSDSLSLVAYKKFCIAMK